VLFDTGPGFRNPEARANGTNVPSSVRGFLKSAGLGALGGGAEARLGKHRSARGLAGAARGMLAQYDRRLIDSLPHIAVPTLVLVGGDDHNFLGATDYMAGKIPGAQKVVIPMPATPPTSTSRRRSTAAVVEFLSGLSRSADDCPYCAFRTSRRPRIERRVVARYESSASGNRQPTSDNPDKNSTTAR